MNKAVDYLGRYAASKERLRQILDRFATRKLDKHDPNVITNAIHSTIARCETLGYLDDNLFAQRQARGHRKLGRSQLGIRQRLRQHRIDDNIIDAAIDSADHYTVSGELLAACVFAQRRKLGPFDRQQNDDAGDQQTIMRRQLGSMARAGFTLAISLRVMELEDKATAEQLIIQLREREDPKI